VVLLILKIGVNRGYRTSLIIREDKVDFIIRNLKKMQGVILLTVDKDYRQSNELLKILSEQYPRSYE